MEQPIDFTRRSFLIHAGRGTVALAVLSAEASVVTMGNLTFETVLVGHGEPILEGASAQVAALAESG